MSERKDKPRAELVDWYVTTNISIGDAYYLAPERVRRCLGGKVRGHPLHEDGKSVVTSDIVSSDCRLVETRNAVYRLVGPPAAGYIEWCGSNGIEIDDDWPVK